MPTGLRSMKASTPAPVVRRAALPALLSPAAIAALIFMTAAGCGTQAPADPLKAATREHGIEIEGVQLLADGDLARLNYRVVDYEKAKRSLAGEVQLRAPNDPRPLPVTDVGRLGPMRQRPSKTGALQFILFTNSGRILQKGGTAVLVVGGRPIAGIPVS